MGLNIGSFVESFCDRIGLPEQFGDLASAGVNILTQNYGAAIEDGLDFVGEEGHTGGGGDNGFTTDIRNPAAAPGSGKAPKQADRDYDKDFENIQKGIKPEWMEQKEFDKMMLQQRIEEYSAMMTLLSNLMKALHEANMACIRNISA
jgi:hypothetical protein